MYWLIFFSNSSGVHSSLTALPLSTFFSGQAPAFRPDGASSQAASVMSRSTQPSRWTELAVTPRKQEVTGKKKEREKVSAIYPLFLCFTF